MKKTWIIAAAVVCLAAACNKIEEQNDTNAPEVATITYIKADGNESETKGSVDGSTAAFTWNTGDKIAVWAGEYKISDGLDVAYNNTNAATFAFSGDNVVTEGNRANFAIFPAALVWDGSAIRTGSASAYTASSLKLTLPATYTLEQVQGEVSPTPMIATNTPDGDLSFKALCPLLRITVVNIPKQTKRIEFDFNGKKVQGEFTLAGVVAGETAIATSATSGTDDIITVTMADNKTWHDNLVVNLPVPTGTYGDITITAYDAVSDGLPVLTLTRPIKTSAAWAPTRKSSRKMTATLPVFTAANGQKVTIAPGNLLYSNTQWSFHTHQYDRCFSAAQTGDAVLSIFSETGTFDLFSWGTSGWSGSGVKSWVNYEPWSCNDTAYSGDDYIYNTYGYGPDFDGENKDLTGVYENGDWGINNKIGVYPKGAWRTPSNADWISFISSRTTTSSGLTGDNSSQARQARATVAGIKGIILFPDNYNHPADAEITYNSNKFNFTGNINGWGNAMAVDATNWSKMEASGAVFLPTGARHRGNRIMYSEGGGWYQSASAKNKDENYTFSYGDGSVSTGGNMSSRFLGVYVRLIRDLN